MVSQFPKASVKAAFCTGLNAAVHHSKAKSPRLLHKNDFHSRILQDNEGAKSHLSSHSSTGCTSYNLDFRSSEQNLAS